MKKHKRAAAIVMSGVMSATSLFSLTGCYNGKYTAERLNDLALDFALNFIMGNDAFGWNVFSVTPYESYGYVSYGEPTWYSYSGTTSKSQIKLINYMFNDYANELKHYDVSKLKGADADTYRALSNTLNMYQTYYKSKYASDFGLLGGDYITSEGGYVADFASTFENYTFRSESDVKDLLSLTESTGDAFKTYLKFAGDRDSAGYPLYDYTVVAMQDYLNDVYEKGEEYYLYEVANSKIDKANFLSESEKSQYKSDYKAALTNNYMTGVKALSDGLENYKGKVETIEKSYLAAAGNAGRAYYEWSFLQKTGIKNANMSSLYYELIDAVTDYEDKMDDVLAQVEALKETDNAAYEEFNQYMDNEKVLLDLTDPNEIIDYLKNAAKDIVPDLKAQPQIGFKYMDETVAEISNAVAYYVRTPLDQENSPEMITLNPAQIEKDPSNLLITIAHEGYPGHLYAHVNSKESGSSLLTSATSCTAFSEGWSQYTELVLLQNIAAASDKATALYCDYKRYEIMSGYVEDLLYDLQVNYFGYSVSDYVDMGVGKDDATRLISVFMEIPAVYVPYGYGMYTMIKLHDKAQKELGDKYDEVEFNGALLSEGFGPTLTRAKQITNNYISAAKKKK